VAANDTLIAEATSAVGLRRNKVVTEHRATEPSLMPVATLVLWLGCLAIGGLGLMLPYARAAWKKEPEPEPIRAELIDVEVVNDPLPTLSPPPRAPELLQPPPAAPPLVIPPPPPMISVAAPSPTIAFAIPVSMPARVVPAREASFRTVETPPIEAAPIPVPVAQPLTFGQGEGRQPAPEYPRQALREGQEGAVTVRMTVGEDGRVLAAEAASPSPWPLLNQAALRVVKSRWRFRPGPVRTYEVAIRFQLKR
jgi:protein TonB